MKRIIISIMIFSLCLFGALTELFCVKNSVESYIEEIEIIDAYMLSDDFTSASNKCRELEDKWSDTLRTIDVVLIHDYVDQISINISQMKSYIDSRSRGMYFACSETAKRALESVKDSEYPLPENIL